MFWPIERQSKCAKFWAENVRSLHCRSTEGQPGAGNDRCTAETLLSGLRGPEMRSTLAMVYRSVSSFMLKPATSGSGMP